MKKQPEPIWKKLLVLLVMAITLWAVGEFSRLHPSLYILQAGNDFYYLTIALLALWGSVWALVPN